MRTVLIFAVCLFIPSVAFAQYDEPAEPSTRTTSPSTAENPPATLQGLTLSAGSGFGLPFGDVVKSTYGTGAALGDGISGLIPIALGAGYRLNDLFSFGLSFQYAVLATKNCDPGSSCSASDTRIGGEVRVHFVAEQGFSPWLSIGGGYEWLSLSESGAHSVDGSVKGFEFETQLGGDIRINPIFTLGPFVGLRVGNFDSLSSAGRSADIPSSSQGTHGWVTFGLRGAFTLN